jgi:hypothetical protein
MRRNLIPRSLIRFWNAGLTTVYSFSSAYVFALAVPVLGVYVSPNASVSTFLIATNPDQIVNY